MNEPPKILIVDDEPFNVDYLEQELADLNYITISASNGQEALDKIIAESPDLVLLDIMMPIMDGFSVLAQLKADSTLRDIPVIIISAMNDLNSVVKGIRHGAEDYLSKPFEPVLLHARISSSLEKKRLRDEHRRLIRTFADKEVAEELMSKGFSLGGKHTRITSMFTDIRNFTTITEAHDPAETIDMLFGFFWMVFVSVQAHGGNANQMQGDGLMSFFGAPVAYPDHAQRAVDSGLEIIQRLAAYNREQADRNGIQIDIGIGLATGQVVAGFAGTRSRATYLCVGDPVNLSARIESHTKTAKRPMLIDKNTHTALTQAVAFESLGEELFKGKTVRIEIFGLKVDFWQQLTAAVI